MKTEVFDNAADFMKALKGGRSKKSGTARAARGDGDRQKDLEKLARAGYTCTHYQDGLHWMTGAAGTTPKAATYREMLDTALCLSQTRPDEVTQ